MLTREQRKRFQELKDKYPTKTFRDTEIQVFGYGADNRAVFAGVYQVRRISSKSIFRIIRKWRLGRLDHYMPSEIPAIRSVVAYPILDHKSAKQFTF